jgi:hypothetical protein
MITFDTGPSFRTSAMHIIDMCVCVVSIAEYWLMSDKGLIGSQDTRSVNGTIQSARGGGRGLSMNDLDLKNKGSDDQQQ